MIDLDPIRSTPVTASRWPLHRTRVPRTRSCLLAALAFACSAATPVTGAAAGAEATSSAASTDAGSLVADPAAVLPPILGRVDPDTYRVGPGDAFAFRVSDLLDARVVRVNPEGAILLPDVGAIAVGGLTLREADAKVRGTLRPFVRGRGLVFTLHAPRRFRMNVLGEVASPGPVTLQAPARASEAIAAAGGVGPAGVRRGIELRRGVETLAVDLVRYERAGDLDANPLVFETDVLFVPAGGEWIEVHGGVQHGGRYDFARGDRVSALVALAGGLRPDASLEAASIERFVDSVLTERVTVDLAAALAAPGSGSDPELRGGDRLFVPVRAGFMRATSVEIAGEVARPGIYPILEGVDRVRSVIDRAGGLTGHADAAAARIERALPEAARDSTFLLLARDQEGLLLSRDREMARLESQVRASVSADLGALLLQGDERHDVTLLSGDRIVVPRRVAFVTVQGEVKRPGAVPWQEGWNAPDYVRAAGGSTGRAWVSHARVTRAGRGQPVDAGQTGALRPGDLLWVPARPDRSGWSVIRDIISTGAQVATIVLVIREATR